MATSTEKYEKSIKVSKGLLLVFFAAYLIYFGIFLSNFIQIFQANNPGKLPLSISYLPLLCYIGGGFMIIGFVIFIRNIRIQKTRQLKSEKKFRIAGIYKTALFISIFIFAFMPLTLPIFDRGVNNHNFSVYNYGWNGASDFKKTLDDDGYNTYCVQSSLSATERIANKSILLVLLGPNQYYNPIFTMPYFVDFFKGNNSILICHDHGSTSMLLWEIYLSSLYNTANQNQTSGTVPVTLFANGILYDNASYATNPEFPVITDLEPHPTTQGISKVILSKASAVAGGPLVSFFGWNVIGRSSAKYSYVDTDGDGVYRYKDDNIDISFITNSIPGFPKNMTKIPLGYPFTPIVFMATDTGNTRVFVTSDASMFDNELINEPGYDNKQFGVNIINWLTRYQNKKDWIVVFDEAHIRPEYTRDLSSAGIFGFILQYVIQLSTNPITAWIYPLLAVYSLRKILPKKGKKKEKEIEKEQEKKEQQLKFRTSSFFSKKIKEYHDKNQYKKAILLLYRRVERKLHAQLGDQKINPKNIERLIKAKQQQVNKSKIKRINRFIGIIEDLRRGKEKLEDEIDFENLFYEMEWVVNNI